MTFREYPRKVPSPDRGHGPAAPAPAHLPRLEVTWSLPWSLSRFLPRCHTAQGTQWEPRSPGQPHKRLTAVPEQGATQQPQAVWVPTPTHKPGLGLGTRVSWASPPREPRQKDCPAHGRTPAATPAGFRVQAEVY